MRLRLSFLLLPLWLGLVMLVGCRSSQLPGAPPRPERVSVAPLMKRGASVYEIDPQQSEIRALVFRTGRLATLGHNHVISATGLSGSVYLQSDFAHSGFELSLPVASLVVDDPKLRGEEGEAFPGEIAEADILGTRENMLGARVLDAQAFPEITVTAIGVSGARNSASLAVQIVLRGVPANFTVPTIIALEDGKLTATGQMEISHSDFGLEPFSALLGAIAVADTIPIKFRLVAVET